MKKAIILSIMAGALLGACTHFEETTMKLPDADRPIVIAHRGASAEAPENTLAAFKLAAEQGADYFELDCLPTADGEVAVIHDVTLERTTSGRGRVDDRTMAHLRELDAGSWFAPEFAGERVPTLGEALALGRERGIGVYVEMKSNRDYPELEEKILQLVAGGGALSQDLLPMAEAIIDEQAPEALDYTERVIEAIRETGMSEMVVIQTFSPVLLLAVQSLAPDLRAEFLGCDDLEDPRQWERVGRWLETLAPDGVNVCLRAAPAGQVAQWQAKGMSVALWSVNEPAEIREAAARGADAIITDYPARALAIYAGE